MKMMKIFVQILYSFEHEQIEFNEYKDLNKYTIGAWNGDSPITFLEAEGVTTMQGKNSGEILVRLLEMNRLDFVCTEALGFNTIARGFFPDKTLYSSDKILWEETGGIFFSLKHPDGEKLYNLFKNELTKYLVSDEWKKISEKYYDAVGLDVNDFIID